MLDESPTPTDRSIVYKDLAAPEPSPSAGWVTVYRLMGVAP
jgi:hypothetical protein